MRTFPAAPAHCAVSLAQTLAWRTPKHPANDNEIAQGAPDQRVLNAALRYFAQHGLSAAQLARKEAERAFFAGDRESYQWWLGICRTLDRRLAARAIFP